MISALAVVACLAAAGDDRPSDDAMFGSPEPAADAGVAGVPSDVPPAPTGPITEGNAHDTALAGPQTQSKFDTDEQKSDPLKVGGTLYLRGTATWTEGNRFEQIGWGVPSLLDLYLDARPSDRVRGFALGRLKYDASQPSTITSSFGIPSLTGAAVSSTPNPSVALDQLWLRFDIAQKVFFTVGRQKVKWGTARLWTPGDVLNAQRKDPLNPFDLRLGVNAVKVHVPVESLGWNFYGFGLLDAAGPANVFGKLGGAARAEIVLGPAEFGFGGVWVKGQRPRYTIDVSSALGPIDVYLETAFRDGADYRLWRVKNDFAIDIDRDGQTVTKNYALDSNGTDAPLTSAFESYSYSGIQVQATAGLSWTVNYNDKNTLTFGAEYFHNPVGASSALFYPWLIAQGDYTTFYAGRDYVGLFALAPGLPGGLDWVSLNFTGLMNITDPSATVRLDAFFRVLSFLSVEAFVAGNMGLRGGEFRFALKLPSVALPDGSLTEPIDIRPPIASAGIGLRVSM